MSKFEVILPVVIIVINFLAAVGYGIAGDYRRALYWFFCTCIAITVTV